MSKLVSMLYKLARAANDISKVASGDPKKIARRAKNKIVGKKLNKTLGKFLWKQEKVTQFQINKKYESIKISNSLFPNLALLHYSNLAFCLSLITYHSLLYSIRSTQYAIQYLTGRPADYLLLYLDSIPDTRYSMLVFIKIGNKQYSAFLK